MDKTSVPGIIELEIQEYYNNSIAELPDVISHNEEHQIIGQTVVYQDTEVGYMLDEKLFEDGWKWTVLDNERVRIIDVDKTGRICKVKIHQGAIGGFTIRCGDKRSGYTMDVKIKID